MIFIGVLWRWPGSFWVIGLTELILGAGAALVRLSEVLLVNHTATGLGGYSYWLPLSYIMAFIVLPPRPALLFSLGLFGGLAGLGIVYWSSPEVPLQYKTLYGNSLVQMYAMHVTMIVCLGLLLLVQRHYVSAIARAQAQANLAHTDPLTGLANRRQLDDWLQMALHESQATGIPMSVILFDLDHFKRVNDTYGHAVGDEVLRATATATRCAVRGVDRVGRWGGEEFMVLIAGDLRAAEMVAQRVREALQNMTLPLPVPVTVSCGLAQARPDDAPADLLQRADQALYEAKGQGRDAVAISA
ncbi:GGDEF domain-containing protein [Deinococcus malanensis]